MQASADVVLAAFRKCYLWDVTMAQPGRVADYLPLFPGFEDAVAAEYERLSSENGLEAPRRTAERPRIGPYRLESFLGRGGQGTVYKATDTRDGRTVALKILASEAGQPERRLLRLRREAAAIAQVDHPGICGIHEAGLDGAVPYLALHFVPGSTLADLIAGARREHPESIGKIDAGARLGLPGESSGSKRDAVSRVAHLVERAAIAVHAAHEAGLVHRDVKPGNVMVTPEGEPVILDFGLVRDEEEGGTITLSGALLGTPAYMAPEQLSPNGMRLDRRVDVHALGMCLYESLTLLHPFDRPTHEAAGAALMQEARDLREIDPRFPASLALIVATALRRDRDRRYSTALALAQDLRAFRTGSAIRARPPSAPQRLADWARRRPVLAASTAVAFVSLSAGLIVSLQLLSESRRERTVATDARRATDDLLQYMLHDLRDKLQPLGRLQILEAVAEKAKSHFDALPLEELSDDDRVRLGRAYNNLEGVFELQGRLEEAAHCCDRAYALHREVFDRRPDDGDALLRLAVSTEARGRLEDLNGDIASAISRSREAENLFARIGEPFATGPLVRDNRARVLRQLGDQLARVGRIEESIEVCRRALAIVEALVLERPSDSKMTQALIAGRTALAGSLELRGDRSEARDQHRRALELARPFASERPGEPHAQQVLASCLLVSADQAIAEQDVDAASKAAAESCAIYKFLGLNDPTNLQWKQWFARATERMAWVHIRRGEHDDVVEKMVDATVAIESSLKTGPGNRSIRRDIAGLKHRTAISLAFIGREAEAIAQFEECRRLYDTIAAQAPADRSTKLSIVRFATDFAQSLRSFADLHQYAQRRKFVAGDPVDSAEHARADELGKRASTVADEAEANARELVKATPSSATYRLHLALALKERVEVRVVRGEFAEAARVLDEAIALRTELVALHPSYAKPLGDLDRSVRYIGVLGGLIPPATPVEQRWIGIHAAMTGDSARALTHLREAVRDPAVRRELRRWALWQATRAAAMESSKAADAGDAARLRTECLAWLTEEVALRREAIRSLDDRLTAMAQSAKERAGIEKERKDHIEHLERLHVRDPAFASLRGALEFESIFAAK